MLTLTIYHNVFLTKEEREFLIKEDFVYINGVSVPVWFHKGTTSEPAMEVFCKYKIFNDGSNTPISKIKNGYKIYLPKYLEDKKILINNILDYRDGGIESIKYKEYNKVLQSGIYYNIIHFVEINLSNKLIETISK